MIGPMTKIHLGCHIQGRADGELFPIEYLAELEEDTIGVESKASKEACTTVRIECFHSKERVENEHVIGAGKPSEPHRCTRTYAHTSVCFHTVRT
jgi:hypothetical protein